MNTQLNSPPENSETTQSAATGAQNILSKLVDFPWLLARLQLVLLNPTECWDTIRQEQMENIDIIKRYVLPLVVTPMAISFVRFAILGFQIPIIGTIRLPFFSTLLYAIVLTAVIVGTLFVSALIMQKLAPRFEAQLDSALAFKLVAYAMTPTALLLFLPLFGNSFMQYICWGASAYGAYLLFQGMTRLIGTPEPRRVPYFAATLGASIMATSLIIWILNSVLLPGAPTPDFSKFNDQVELTPQEIQKGLEMLQKNLPK